MAVSIEPWEMNIDLLVKIHLHYFITILPLSQCFLQNKTRREDNFTVSSFYLFDNIDKR